MGKQECYMQLGNSMNGKFQIFLFLAVELYFVLTWDSVRKQPDQIFTGYLSIIMLEVNLMLMRSRNMLLCGEW